MPLFINTKSKRADVQRLLLSSVSEVQLIFKSGLTAWKQNMSNRDTRTHGDPSGLGKEEQLDETGKQTFVNFVRRTEGC